MASASDDAIAARHRAGQPFARKITPIFILWHPLAMTRLPRAIAQVSPSLAKGALIFFSHATDIEHGPSLGKSFRSQRSLATLLRAQRGNRVIRWRVD